MRGRKFKHSTNPETTKQPCPMCGALSNQPCRILGRERVEHRPIVHDARLDVEKWWLVRAANQPPLVPQDHNPGHRRTGKPRGRPKAADRQLA